MKHELKTEYISIHTPSKNLYGGNQTLSPSPAVRAAGCGIISACDLLLYISNSNASLCSSKLFGDYYSKCLEFDVYNRLLLSLNRRYFHVIPPFGMTGLQLAAGLNICFIKLGLSQRARWCIASGNIFGKIADMLDRDIPVIFSVGPNFPFFWKNEKAQLYQKDEYGKFFPLYSAKAHFMNITGMDDDWLRLSSWGKELYLKKADYLSYIKTDSNSIVSNMVYII